MSVVDLYTIQIIDERSNEWVPYKRRVAALMAETEENLTDLLPDGYTARIRRWDHPGDEGDTDE